MKNREKYAEVIKNYKSDNFCYDFVMPVILKKKECDMALDCAQCYLIQQLWLDEEYKEPEVDWSKVPVDTLIRVKDCESDDWNNRYFSKCKNGLVYAWNDGATSKTSVNDVPWKIAELVNEDIK